MKTKRTTKSPGPTRVPKRRVVARRADTGQYETVREAEDETKSARMEGRIALNIKKIIQRAAELSGRSFTDFVVAAAHQDALRTIREHEILKLSERDTKTFLAALTDKPRDIPPLRKAAQRFKDLQGQT
jgi:uncharacterized protein (DUF1778 family)